MSKEETIEALKNIKLGIRSGIFYSLNDREKFINNDNFKILEQALQRLESIDNANPSEALKCLEKIDDMFYLNKYRTTDGGNKEEYEFYPRMTKEYDVIENFLLKAQEQEKENELLKEIIKSLFDRGCPLHQYTDKEGALTIEVDDECSIMRLGEYKGIDLDKYLKDLLKEDKSE